MDYRSNEGLIKYYHLRDDRNPESGSIGLITQIDDKFDIGKIKEALEVHFDTEISNVNIERLSVYNDNLIISFKMLGEEEFFISGEQTWLIFKNGRDSTINN